MGYQARARAASVACAAASVRGGVRAECAGVRGVRMACAACGWTVRGRVRVYGLVLR